MDERKVSVVIRGELVEKQLDEISNAVKYDVRDQIPSILLGKETLYLVDIKIREISDELLEEVFVKMKNKCKIRIIERVLANDVKEVVNVLRSGDPLRISRIKSEFENHTILIKKDGGRIEVPTSVLRWANKSKVIVEIPKKFLISIADNQFGFYSFLDDKIGYLLQR